MIKHRWRRSELVVEKEKHLAAASWGHFLPIHTVLPSSISRWPAASWHLLLHACLDFFISLSFSSNQAPTCLLPAFSHSGPHFPTLILTCNFPTKYSWVSSPSLNFCVAELSLGSCGIYLGHWRQVLCSGSHQLPLFLWRPTCLFPFPHSSTFLLYSMGV